MNQHEQLREAAEKALEALGTNCDRCICQQGTCRVDEAASALRAALTATQQAAPSQGAGELIPPSRWRFERVDADQIKISWDGSGLVIGSDGSGAGAVAGLALYTLAAALLEASAQRDKPNDGRCEHHACLYPTCECEPEAQAQAGDPKPLPDELQRVVNRLNSSDVDFDDCADAADLILQLASDLQTCVEAMENQYETEGKLQQFFDSAKEAHTAYVEAASFYHTHNQEKTHG